MNSVWLLVKNPHLHTQVRVFVMLSLKGVAGMTGFEPATSGSTVRCSNQLSYIPKHYAVPNVNP